MTLDRTTTKLKALAERSRLRIVLALSRIDELCACQITGLLQVTGASASRHLAVLQRAGLVEKRRQGRWIWYRLDHGAAHAELLAWARSATAEDHGLAADRKALEKILSVDPVDYCRLRRGAARCAKTKGKP